jgi:YD repeat-containing protein
MTIRKNSATMRVVWDALGQVIREVLYWVLVLVIGDGSICYALIFSLRDLGTGIVPTTFS